MPKLRRIEQAQVDERLFDRELDPDEGGKEHGRDDRRGAG